MTNGFVSTVHNLLHRRHYHQQQQMLPSTLITVLLKKPTVTRLAKKPQARDWTYPYQLQTVGHPTGQQISHLPFTEPVHSQPCPQQPANGLHSEPNDSHPATGQSLHGHRHALLTMITLYVSQLILR
jgi:hypothetical protein